ncbi:unnamed protein product [Mycetohabitans rhizoxinica HKI 454]|uniref:Uncharacterized protein n=1 Tax=Mycetohabitans rhizoxinica (strain DSM 19002 / CIP 109453 / HKI 454) TaxID=882378 RepID=E5ANI1_MYCRK|nr:unnamed protein product [Mycetohabitans rhizoxinica HKI 454]
MALADDLVDRLRAQPFCQRDGGAGIFEHGLTGSLRNDVQALWQPPIRPCGHARRAPPQIRPAPVNH